MDIETPPPRPADSFGNIMRDVVHAVAGWCLSLAVALVLASGLADVQTWSSAGLWSCLAALIVFVVLHGLAFLVRLPPWPRAAMSAAYLVAFAGLCPLVFGAEALPRLLWMDPGVVVAVILGVAQAIGGVWIVVILRRWWLRVLAAGLLMPPLLVWAIGLFLGGTAHTIVTGAVFPWPAWAYQDLVLVGVSDGLLGGLLVFGLTRSGGEGSSRWAIRSAVATLALVCAGYLGLDVPQLDVSEGERAAREAPEKESKTSKKTETSKKTKTSKKRKKSKGDHRVRGKKASADARVGDKKTGGSPTAIEPDTSRYDCTGVVFPGRDIGKIRARYPGKGWRANVLAMLKLRFPAAVGAVETLDDPNHFDLWFHGEQEAWDAMQRSIGTAVHEAVHLAGLARRRGLRKYPYWTLKEGLVHMPYVRSFHRSEILDHLPADVQGMSWAKIYLTGNSGAQGLETLLDELNAYIWSLYTDVALLDQIRGRRGTGRAGLLTMMLYTQTYLKLARLEHPKVHRALLGNAKYRAFLVSLWDHAKCVLELSGDDRRLGYQEEQVRPYVFAEERIREIERLRP